MTSSRLRRIVRARWWVLALIALVTIVIATMFVNARNDSFPKREAVAGITFQRLLGEPDDTDLQQRLSDASQIATDVNAPQIAAGIDPLSPGALGEIVADILSGRLLFFGRGDTDDAASSLAVGLRDRYLEAQSLDDSVEIDRRISQTTVQLDDVVALIAAASEEPPIDEAEIARRIKIRELQAELSALTARYGVLTVELITPTDPPRETAIVEAERAAIRRQLNATESELLALQEAEVEIAPEDAAVALLRSEETQLRILLDELVAQRFADEPIATLDAIETGGSGIEPLSALPIQALALILGMFIGLAGLVLLDRSRHPVWAATDLQPRYRLPEIPKRQHSRNDQTSQSWYLIAPQGRRKAGVQQLRSHVEGLQGFGSGVAVGIASLSSQSRDVHELAADLAAGLSGSGTRTLLIDADFGNPTDLVDFRRSGCDLKAALDDPTGCLSQADPETDETSVSGISISRKIADSPDLLARPEFADLLTAAKYEYGVAIIACPPSDTPGYHVLTQRLDAMILVSDAGAPLPIDLDNALHTLEDRRSHPLGVVLLTAAGNPLRAVVDRIPGGPDLRRAMAGLWFGDQQPRTGVRPSHAEETPATATPEIDSDADEKQKASSAGVRVEFVSGSNQTSSTASDEPSIDRALDGSRSRSASTDSEGTGAASLETRSSDRQTPNSSTVRSANTEHRSVDSPNTDILPIDFGEVPPENEGIRGDAAPVIPTAADDASERGVNTAAVGPSPTASPTEESAATRVEEARRPKRTRKTATKRAGTTRLNQKATTPRDSTSVRTADNKTPGDSQLNPQTNETSNDLPAPSGAADTGDDGAAQSTTPGIDEPEIDTFETTKPRARPQSPDTKGGSNTRRRNARGQFLPVVEPSVKTAVDKASTSDPTADASD